MDSNQQYSLGVEGGGGMYRQAARVMDVPTGEYNTMMQNAIRMKRSKVYAPADLGITNTRVMQKLMRVEDDGMDMTVAKNGPWGDKDVDCVDGPTVDIANTRGLDCVDGPTVDIASTRGFKTEENFAWTASKEMEVVPSPEADNAAMPYSDEIIDMKAAKKKVIPAEVKDECNQLIEIPEVRQKIRPLQKAPQKRHLLSAEGKKDASPPNAPVWVDTETDNRNLRDAVSLLRDIQNGTSEPRGINFRREVFSGFDQLKQVELVGKGSFGEVSRVVDVNRRQVMMQKKVKKVERNEVLIPLQFPQQDSLARIFGFAWDGEDALIVQEDAGISLRLLIGQKDKLSLLEEPGRVEMIMLDVYKGIDLLSKHSITHCDIKPENVCLNEETMRAKLIDFGSSRTSQDVMTYKGITPEYLPPGLNKFLYRYLVCGERSIAAPRLGEKDDVWAAGLVGLFLMTKAHPMIKWVVGWPDYNPRLSPEEKERLRNKVMEKISQLCDQPMCPDNPREIPVKDVLKKVLSTRSYTNKAPIMEELLDRVLVVDEENRLTSAEAVRFLQKHLELNMQPPTKALKRWESGEDEDLDVDVDLKKAKEAQSYEPSSDYCMPDSPKQDQCPALGVALKHNPSSTHQQQTGNILAPAKFIFQPPQLTSAAAAQTPSRPAPSQPVGVTPQPLPPAPAQLATLHQFRSRRVVSTDWHDDSEASEYENLVESFNVSAKVTPGPPQQAGRYQPLAQAQSQPPQPVATGFQAQVMGFAQRAPTFGYQDMDMSKRHNKIRSRPSHVGLVDPTSSCEFAVKGFFGGDDVVFRNDGQVVNRVIQNSEGNVPNMDALMSESVEESIDNNRPKVKARRRNGPNRD